MKQQRKEEEQTEHMPSYIDYKDVALLRKFLNPHGRIQPRYRTRLSAKQHRQLARAIKRARFMALLPFVVK